MTKLDKEKIVRDLVGTFEDRNELHIAYKKKMKEILTVALVKFIHDFSDEGDSDGMTVAEWIDDYVETHFRPSND